MALESSCLPSGGVGPLRANKRKSETYSRGNLNVPPGHPSEPNLSGFFRHRRLLPRAVERCLLWPVETHGNEEGLASGHDEGSNDVSVVDLESGKVTTIAVGQGPRKLVVQSAAKRDAADAGGTAKVSIVNFAFNPSSITIRPG